MAKALKTVFLTLVSSESGFQAQHTIATVRANKTGKRAQLQFVGDKNILEFETVRDAYWHLVNTAHKNPLTYFLMPDGVADFWELA